MPVGRKKKFAIAQRRQLVTERYLEGSTQTIAQKLGVSQPTVSTDIKAIEKEWRCSALHNFDRCRGMELAKLDHLESEAWQAWRRSQEPVETTRVIQQGTERRAEKRVTQQYGDRRFLELILRLHLARRELLGLDPSARSTSASPNVPGQYRPDIWSELMRLVNECQADPVVIDDEYIRKKVLAMTTTTGARRNFDTGSPSNST